MLAVGLTATDGDGDTASWWRRSNQGLAAWGGVWWCLVVCWWCAATGVDGCRRMQAQRVQVRRMQLGGGRLFPGS